MSQATDVHTSHANATRAASALENVSLIDTIINRRSRRFALGGSLDGGPLAYTSKHAAVPLSKEEEAILAFAGAGITGFAHAELPYGPGKRKESGGGVTMYTTLGRTIASPDAHHNVTLFITNDEGTWMMKRPQDFARSEIPELAALAHAKDFVALYERCRIKVKDGRADPPREVPFVLPFNKWSANVPGATYFVPVNETSAFYMNALFAIFSEDFGYYVVDERNGFKGAGIERFARSKGGHLFDDPNDGRVLTVQYLEAYILEMCAVEQGLMLQNIQLAAEAIGLGGFPHYAGHHFGWAEALGFKMERWPLSKIMNKGRVMSKLMSMVGKNPIVPVPIGFEKDGEVLLKPYCPPYYATMTDAVKALLDFKYGKKTGTFRDGGASTSWKDGAKIQENIPEYTRANIDAVTAYLEYVWQRYGRVTSNFGTFRTLLGYQAHHIDTDYYDALHKPGAYTEAHAKHFERWHPRRS